MTTTGPLGSAERRAIFAAERGRGTGPTRPTTGQQLKMASPAAHFPLAEAPLGPPPTLGIPSSAVPMPRRPLVLGGAYRRLR